MFTYAARRSTATIAMLARVPPPTTLAPPSSTRFFHASPVPLKTVVDSAAEFAEEAKIKANQVFAAAKEAAAELTDTAKEGADAATANAKTNRPADVSTTEPSPTLSGLAKDARDLKVDVEKGTADALLDGAKKVNHARKEVEKL